MIHQKDEKIEIIKTRTDTERRNIMIKDPTEKELILQLGKRKNIMATRIKKLLDLPDLVLKENSPVKIITDQIINLPKFRDFDLVTIPRVVSVRNNFDILNTPLNHPSRRETDTYYINNDYVLRTQTTTMWSFYLKDLEIIEKLKKNGNIKALSAGIVYRKDEIDRNHYPAFHQIDGLYICEKKKKVITVDDLIKVLVEVAKGIFGENLEWKTVPDTFPYTDPSIEMKMKWKNKWLEILGAGIVRNQVYPNFGLDPSIYNGWAFGFGLDRLAMVKMGIPDIRTLWSNDERIVSQFKDINSQYKEVSKYPALYRDISFIINKNVSLNNYYEIVREYGGDLVEEVKLLDKYENKRKFGDDKISYTFRIVYRSPERTLESEEINKIQDEIRKETSRHLDALVR